MHAEKAANAMSGAVIVIKPGTPQRLTCKRVELTTAGTNRKPRGCDRDVTLEHAGKPITHFFAGIRCDVGNPHGASNVGSAIEILCSGID